MLLLGAALTREKTGWLRQSPGLAERLVPIEGSVSAAEIERARTDWEAACQRTNQHALQRAKEIGRVARIHRDPFELLLPILEAASPAGEYRKITDEIPRRMPDARRYPRAAAESVRSLLMSVRDVPATHLLKTTGSTEQASYAIQDTPATVQAHYGRFLPQDKPRRQQC